MADNIDFENRTISCFQGLVTLTFTLDRVIWHTVMHHSSTSTHAQNFIRTERTFCGRTYCHPNRLYIDSGSVDLKSYWTIWTPHNYRLYTNLRHNCGDISPRPLFEADCSPVLQLRISARCWVAPVSTELSGLSTETDAALASRHCQ